MRGRSLSSLWEGTGKEKRLGDRSLRISRARPHPRSRTRLNESKVSERKKQVESRLICIQKRQEGWLGLPTKWQE